jgi:hypothetical protein
MAESRTSSPDGVATEEREELLATKLNIPPPRPDQLRRSRLIDRLNQGMAQKLIMVCTPAGFGKTSLLAEWAANTKWAVASLAIRYLTPPGPGDLGSVQRIAIGESSDPYRLCFVLPPDSRGDVVFELGIDAGAHDPAVFAGEL